MAPAFEEGVIDANWVDAVRRRFVATLEEEFEAAKSYLPNKADWFGGRWAGSANPTAPETERRNVGTAIEPRRMAEIGRC